MESFADRICVFLATGFGVSYASEGFCRLLQKNSFRGMPQHWTGAGFLGTVLALGLVVVFLPWVKMHSVWAAVCLGYTAAAVYFTGIAEKVFGNKDDSRIVADEIAGYFWSVAFLPWELISARAQWGILLGAFILFRIFDVAKIPSAKPQEWPGGWGVVMDDVASGLAVNIILQVLCRSFL